jgi:E3 ubiquitin-protein ligase RNF144
LGYYCAVCDERKAQLFEIANCGHRFCADCCTSYIRSQAENFAKAKCLQEGCQAELNKAKPIYRSLDDSTIARIDNYELFLFLQNNKDAAACKQKDCKGYFLKSGNNSACTVCASLHCKQCLGLAHAGSCPSNKQEEEELRALNYRRCPKCAIWVEKIAGCEYINCKCGIEFCYRCGEEYSKDPCRKA